VTDAARRSPGGPDDVSEWPPPAARFQAILWRAERELERREFVAAARTLCEGFDLDEEGLLHALHHLAAAGYKAQSGDVTRARRQLAHARQRLEPFLPARGDVDLVGLLSKVSAAVESPGGELA
jgi:hypothetical protein